MPCLKLNVQTDGHHEVIEFDRDEILIGRSTVGNIPELILKDKTVSRKHARIWRALDGYWIEDLCSTHGTKKRGVPLMGAERVFAGDYFEVGDSLLTVEQADITEIDDDLDALFDVHMSDGFGVGDEQETQSPAAQVRVVAHEEVFAPLNEPDVAVDSVNTRNWSWQEGKESLILGSSNPSLVFGHLTSHFANTETLGYSMELAIKDIVNIVTPAERGAVLLFNADHTQLELCAHHPAFDPAFSSTLALNTLTSGRAFVWEADSSGIVSKSIKKLSIRCGLYAPLSFGQDQLGVVCVDSTNAKAEFTHEELALFINISQVLGALVHGKQARLAKASF